MKEQEVQIVPTDFGLPAEAPHLFEGDEMIIYGKPFKKIKTKLATLVVAQVTAAEKRAAASSEGSADERCDITGKKPLQTVAENSSRVNLWVEEGKCDCFTHLLDRLGLLDLG